MRFVSELRSNLVVDQNDEELRGQVSHNMQLLETLAAELFRKAARLLSITLNGGSINPYAISLTPELWQTDGLFSEVACAATNTVVVEELPHIWLDEREKLVTP